MSQRHGRWMAEFVLIVVGVLAALAVEDWRESRGDRERETHLLEGVRSDLARDLTDLDGSVRSAFARMAAADDLLARINHPDADMVSLSPLGERRTMPSPLSIDYEPFLKEARQLHPQLSVTAQEAVLMATTPAVFDIADATYAEATASGQIDVLTDLELRRAIATYYFDANRFGPTMDQRVESSVERLTGAFARAGISPGGDASHEQIIRAIRQDEVLVAELMNMRYSSAIQVDRHRFMIAAAVDLAARLDGSAHLGGHR